MYNAENIAENLREVTDSISKINNNYERASAQKIDGGKKLTFWRREILENKTT